MKFEYHVKPTGSDAACGDAEHPFATISKAAQMASPGDTVIVHEGVYREQVNPRRGGLSEHERITYCGAEGEARPVIKGSECVQGWTELADHPQCGRWCLIIRCSGISIHSRPRFSVTGWKCPSSARIRTNILAMCISTVFPSSNRRRWKAYTIRSRVIRMRISR